MLDIRHEPTQTKRTYICSACRKQSDTNIMWMYFGFKKLASVWVCGQCWPKQATHLVGLQAQGF